MYYDLDDYNYRGLLSVCIDVLKFLFLVYFIVFIILTCSDSKRVYAETSEYVIQTAQQYRRYLL